MLQVYIKKMANGRKLLEFEIADKIYTGAVDWEIDDFPALKSCYATQVPSGFSISQKLLCN